MRLIDADELIEHAWRDKLDSRELIAQMIENAPTIKEIPTKIPIDIFERLLELAESKIIEKARAEIEQTRKMYFDMNDIDWVNGCDYVLSMIDKHKTDKEQEDDNT